MRWLTTVATVSTEIFTPAEKQAIAAVCGRLSLTHAMQIMLKKGCAAYKSHQVNLLDTLNAHGAAIPAGKQERAAAFGKLLESLQRV
jgi:hypothetical protein